MTSPIFKKMVCKLKGHDMSRSFMWLIWNGWGAEVICVVGDDWICQRCDLKSQAGRFSTFVPPGKLSESKHKQSLWITISKENAMRIKNGFVAFQGIEFPLNQAKYKPEQYSKDYVA